MTITTTDAETEVRTVLDKVYQAWADNDAVAFAELYTPDATVSMTGVFTSGQDGIRSQMEAGFAGPLHGSRAIDRLVEIRFPGSDTAIVSSEAGILMAGETVVPPDRERLATWVLTRTTSGWLITAYHNCPAH